MPKYDVTFTTEFDTRIEVESKEEAIAFGRSFAEAAEWLSEHEAGIVMGLAGEVTAEEVTEEASPFDGVEITDVDHPAIVPASVASTDVA